MTLEEAVRHAIRNALAFGTWDCEFYDYAPPGWARRVKHAPRALRYGIYLDLKSIAVEPNPLEEAAEVVQQLLRDDPTFADELEFWRRRAERLRAEHPEFYERFERRCAA